jgi:hypothetical protein
VLLVERRREQGVHHLVEFRGAARRRDADVPEMPPHVEVRIVFPPRPVEVEQRTDGPLPIARDGREPFADRVDEGGEGERPVEERHAPHVEALQGSLEVEKGRVQGGQTVCTRRHGSTSVVGKPRLDGANRVPGMRPRRCGGGDPAILAAATRGRGRFARFAKSAARRPRPDVAARRGP